MLDFAEIKKIKITDVAGRYGIKLRYRGEWASAPCPLPTHKAGDKGKNFTINLAQNYWRCFSQSCNEQNGGKKGGDVINFVALMENCREREAAEKLTEWFGPNQTRPRRQTVNSQNKSAPQIEAPRSKEIVVAKQPPPATRSPEHNKPSVDGKGYIKALDTWFDELFGIGPELKEDPFWKKCRNAVKSKCIESFNNGKLAARSR